MPDLIKALGIVWIAVFFGVLIAVFVCDPAWKQQRRLWRGAKLRRRS